MLLLVLPGSVLVGSFQGEAPALGQVVGAVESSRPQEGVPHTWYDGDRVRKAWLQPDLTVRDVGKSLSDREQVIQHLAGRVIVRMESRNEVRVPVFRSESGELMTLPGGVLVILDRSWSVAQTNRFFRSNGIAPENILPLDGLKNGFLVRTLPGFPSLELANSLATQQGAVVASPNWLQELKEQ